ncbi:MAG: RNA methyltransferase [Planctomycetes bacterium]|nr:RNA methyltransferase [Planctomycetota bacterium]
MFARITSRRHPHVATFRAAARGDVASRMVVEGPRLVEEALHSRLAPELVLVREGSDEISIRLAQELAARGAAVAEVSAEVLEAATEVKTPQAIAALVATPEWKEEQLFPNSSAALLLVACGIQQPGNLGAILRHGEAFGATGLLALRGSARLHRPAVLRGAMGSLFRLPAREGLTEGEALALLRARGVRLLAFEVEGAVDLHDAPLEQPCALLLGSEAHGVPDELARAADLRVRIPIASTVDSLGVAAASAIALYEAARRRALSRS